MYRIGIDVGSTYTKYCVMENGNRIALLFAEKTPVRQKEYFAEKLESLQKDYPGAEVISCGYGKSNVDGTRVINELTALPRGVFFVWGKDCTVLDIGGQDTKMITQEQGRLREFFINDKCAAGSGMFLADTLGRLGVPFEKIDLSGVCGPSVRLASTCAVFAQSEIVRMIADNRTEDEILAAVIWQIFTMAKPLLGKAETDRLILSGGLCRVEGIATFAGRVLGVPCETVGYGEYLAAVGCAGFCQGINLNFHQGSNSIHFCT